MQGVEFVSPYAGTWEAESDRRGHFTATQLLSDARGAFLGSVTVDGYPEVSEDGESFVDDGSRVIVTIRDVTGAIVPAAWDRCPTRDRHPHGPGSTRLPAGHARCRHPDGWDANSLAVTQERGPRAIPALAGGGPALHAALLNTSLNTEGGSPSWTGPGEIDLQRLWPAAPTGAS